MFNFKKGMKIQEDNETQGNSPSKLSLKLSNSNSKGSRNGSKTRRKPTASSYKVCIGDKVKVSTLNNKLIDEKGTVMYIGYPYPGKGIRYGINLHSAKGDFDGTLMINIKSGKLAKPNHLKKYKKQILKHKYFKARKNHGIFVKLEEITDIDRTSSSTIFTIEDKVKVRFRGPGTIKFVGSLEHTKEMGLWYGIQLKNRRGRHDGTINGVKYFECAPQYGLHCRQNHLELLIEEEHENQRISITSKDDHTPIVSTPTEPPHHGNGAMQRPSLTDKAQKSDKWASLVTIY